jgi:hypothetical protein
VKDGDDEERGIDGGDGGRLRASSGRSKGKDEGKKWEWLGFGWGRGDLIPSSASSCGLGVAHRAATTPAMASGDDTRGRTTTRDVGWATVTSWAKCTGRCTGKCTVPFPFIYFCQIK